MVRRDATPRPRLDVWTFFLTQNKKKRATLAARSVVGLTSWVSQGRGQKRAEEGIRKVAPRLHLFVWKSLDVVVVGFVRLCLRSCFVSFRFAYLLSTVAIPLVMDTNLLASLTFSLSLLLSSSLFFSLLSFFSFWRRRRLCCVRKPPPPKQYLHVNWIWKSVGNLNKEISLRKY